MVACLLTDSEYAGFIAAGLRGFLRISRYSRARRFKIGKSGLRFHKQQVHQTTGGIVDMEPVPYMAVGFQTSDGHSHQFVSARGMAAGNGADEFWVRVVYGNPRPGAS